MAPKIMPEEFKEELAKVVEERREVSFMAYATMRSVKKVWRGMWPTSS